MTVLCVMLRSWLVFYLCLTKVQKGSGAKRHCEAGFCKNAYETNFPLAFHQQKIIAMFPIDKESHCPGDITLPIDIICHLEY